MWGICIEVSLVAHETYINDSTTSVTISLYRERIISNTCFMVFDKTIIDFVSCQFQSGQSSNHLLATFRLISMRTIFHAYIAR